MIHTLPDPPYNCIQRYTWVKMSLENPSSVSPFSRPSIFLLLPAVGRREGPTPPPQPTSNTHFLNVFAFPYFCSPSLPPLLSPARERIHKIKKKWGESTKGENFSPVSSLPNSSDFGRYIVSCFGERTISGKTKFELLLFSALGKCVSVSNFGLWLTAVGSLFFPFHLSYGFSIPVERKRGKHSIFDQTPSPSNINRSHPLQQTHTIAVSKKRAWAFFLKKIIEF